MRTLPAGRYARKIASAASFTSFLLIRLPRAGDFGLLPLSLNLMMLLGMVMNLSHLTMPIY